MNLVPLRDDLLFPLEQTFNKFFEDFFANKSNLNVAKANSTYPKLNSSFDGESYKLSFAVPGVTADDLEVDYSESGLVTIRGKSSKKYQSTESTYYVRELRLSSFERTVQLPEAVVGEPNSAVLSDGILTLAWKIETQNTKSTVKRISVKSE